MTELGKENPMKKHLWMTLLFVAAFIAACAPSQVVFPSPTPTVAPLATSTPTPAPTVTSAPTVEASPTNTATALPTTPSLPTPTVSITEATAAVWQPIIGVSVDEDVDFTSCSGLTPVQFTGSITTTDATMIEFDWLLRGTGKKGLVYNSPTQNINHSTPGTYKVESAGFYKTKCGRYTLSLQILYPNPMLATKSFAIP